MKRLSLAIIVVVVGLSTNIASEISRQEQLQTQRSAVSSRIPTYRVVRALDDNIVVFLISGKEIRARLEGKELLCVEGQGATKDKFDKRKFDGVYRSAKIISGALAVGANQIKFNELLQSFAAEVLILNDKVESEPEMRVLKMYAEVLDNYKDGLVLWKQSGKNEYGTITLSKGDPIDMIALKYKLPIVDSSVGNWLAPGALQTLWNIADRNLRTCDYVLSLNSR